MSGFYKLALSLTIIGAINWLLVGLFHWNLVGAIFRGDMSMLSRIVYTIVGICGFLCIGLLTRRYDAGTRTLDREVQADRNVRKIDDVRRGA
jgi:uncharacterized membrane protein YuzA (DUF378 family)